ncbi:MAG: hypothetical protein AABX98_00015, partial [Nanoarchaeota archaeon]
VDVTFYGIPFLPIIRNEVLEGQEREVSFSVPEYVVSLQYRKRRFVLPKDYQRVVIEESEVLNEEHISQEIVIEGTPSKGLQLKLF